MMALFWRLCQMRLTCRLWIPLTEAFRPPDSLRSSRLCDPVYCPHLHTKRMTSYFTYFSTPHFTQFLPVTVSFHLESQKWALVNHQDMPKLLVCFAFAPMFAAVGLNHDQNGFNNKRPPPTDYAPTKSEVNGRCRPEEIRDSTGDKDAVPFIATAYPANILVQSCEEKDDRSTAVATHIVVASKSESSSKQDIQRQCNEQDLPSDHLGFEEPKLCIPGSSEARQESSLKERPFLKKIFDIDNRTRQIYRDYFGSSLQSLPDDYTKKTKPEEHEPTLDTDYEDFHFLMAPTIRFTPAGRSLQVYYNELLERRPDMRSELARYGSFDISSQSSSQSRSAMPWLSRLAQTGVWISHLAQAGFYRPEGSEGKLRCAFCNLDVDSAQLEGTRPMDVHRQLSPNCRFVTGQHATESQPREALGPDYLQMMFAPERQASQASPPQEHQTAGDVSRIGASLSSEVPESPSPARPPRGSEGAVEDSQYQLPHPGQLLTNQNAASVTQASASYQPVSLPMNVQTSDRSSLLGAAQLQQVPQPASLSVQTSSASGRLVQQATQQPSQQAHVYQTARPSTTDRQRSPAEGSQSQDPAQTPTSAAARNVAEIPAQQSGSSTAAAPAEVPSSQNASTSSETPRQVVTYAQLGIFTQQPKRQDMVVGATRCNTFSGWPHAETHTPEEMSDAGFYYTGHSDLVRCFYCKGGLKSWAEHLRPWVEHARFFPECPYVKQVKGHVYVEVVQDLHTKQERVTPEEVEDEIRNRSRSPDHQGNIERTAKSEATILAENGAVGGAVGGASGAVGGATGQPEGGLTDEYLENADVAELDKRAEELENTIEEAKEERICKICRENEANILFLPCGHLVSCAHCAPALRTCAICRERVKGRVRVYTDNEDG